MNTPKISICIPTYNMAKYVGLAVQSAINQTYSAFEVVICDNASTDNTADILTQFTDPRIKIYHNPENVGAIRNFNLAIERASGEWIKFLEADDLLEPTCLEKCMEMIALDSEIDVVSVGRTRIYANGTPFLHEVHRTTEIALGKTLRQRVHLRHNEFGTPTDVMARKELLLSVGGFDVDFGNYLNDWDLWLRCQETARKVALVSEPLVQVRSHGGQIGATGAKANVDIDVVFLMLHKRWNKPELFSSSWWQMAYLKLALAAPYLFRGFKQAVQGKMLPGISKWDAWQRLYKHLGWAGFIFTLLFSIFYLPLYPWYSRYLTNAITLNPSGQAVAPRFVQSPVFSVIAIAIDLIVTLSLLALLLSPLLKYRRFQNK